jgi:DNA repair exonuclease SbcCD ATPase subunit
MHFNNPIGMLREEIKNIKNIVEIGELNAELRRNLKKLLEKLQETLRMEVDDMIPKVKAEAVEERDAEWRKLIDQDYVKKDVVTDLNNMIKEQDTTIINLRNTIEDKDVFLNNNKYEISQLKASKQREKKDLENQIGDLLRENIGLKEEIGDLSEFIGIYLDDAGRRERENFRHEEKVLNGKKTDFDRFVKGQQSNLDGLFFESDEKLKSIKKREEELAEQKEKLKKQQQELETTWKTISENINNLEKWQEDIDNQRDNIKKRWETVLKIAEEQKNKEQRLQKWQTNLEKTGGFNKFSLPCLYCGKPKVYDATDQEINQKISNALRNDMHPKCRIKSEKQKNIILRPLSISGEPVLQSGFSHIIQSGGEPMIVLSGLEPVVQLGVPSILQSGEETKVFESSGGNMIQSGYLHHGTDMGVL